MLDKKHCANCGAEIDQNAVICVKCGANPVRKPLGKDSKFCVHCGEKIDLNAEVCIKCGVKQVKQKGGSTGEKSPVTAAILALIAPIFGYLYLGPWKRGLVVLAMAFIGLLILGLFGAFIVNCVAAYDVYKCAKNEPAPFDFLNSWDWVAAET